MARERKKPLKISSINGDQGNETKEVKLESEKLPPKENSPVSSLDSKDVSNSPLLKDSVDIMEHATDNTPIASDSFEMDKDFFSTKPVMDTPVPPKIDPIAPSVPPVPIDAPEQNFNSNPSAATDNIPIDDSTARQAAADLADTIMDMYLRLVPEVSHSYSKINEKEIKKLEQSGDLMAGAHLDVKETNKENKQALVERAKSDAAMIKKPLKRLLEVKQIQAPPHIELIIVLVFVAITYMLMVRDIKKNNDSLLERLMSKINSNKNQESDVPLVETEEVL